MSTSDIARSNNSGTTTTSAVAVLNLPRQSCIRLDGQTILLQRDDFVGVAGIPLNGFHLLAVRPCIQIKELTKEPVFASITTGFVLPTRSNSTTPLMLLRKYDPQTEEVSNEALDERTRTNLSQQIMNNAIDPQRLIPYASVMRSEATALAWQKATAYITQSLLTSRGISACTKIVPGSQDDETSDFINETLQDGISPKYPAIPVLDDEGYQGRHARSSHRGTKRFLQSLSPMQRTALLMDKDPSSTVFGIVIRDVYRGNWRDLLGDIQLSYTLFLNLHCHASLEHWRDAVALCCRVVRVEDKDNEEGGLAFFASLVDVLSIQVQTMESDFLDDVEMSGDNFLIPSLRRLLQTLYAHDGLAQKAHDFHTRLRDRLPHQFDEDVIPIQNDKEDNDRMMMECDGDENDPILDDNDDDDGPVVVDAAEIQAAYHRQANERPQAPQVMYPVEMRQRFPILFAAQLPHEDIVMTCARALDVATDVSLVREAAEYLEQVEAKQQQ